MVDARDAGVGAGDVDAEGADGADEAVVMADGLADGGRLHEVLDLRLAGHAAVGDGVDEVELARIEAALPGQTVRYSRAQPETVASYRVLLIDNVGMLTSLYRYGSFAYVGGAFGKSLHNVLEPATFGMPIYFGNRRYRHVGEASTLVERGGAFPVANYQELRRHFLGHYRHEEQQQSVAELTRRFVVNHTGATDKIIQYVETMRVNNELWKV